MKLAENAIMHSRSKHIHLRYHAIRDFIEHHEVKPVYIPTSQMLADSLTKAANGEILQYLSTTARSIVYGLRRARSLCKTLLPSQRSIDSYPYIFPKCCSYTTEVIYIFLPNGSDHHYSVTGTEVHLITITSGTEACEILRHICSIAKGHTALGR